MSKKKPKCHDDVQLFLDAVAGERGDDQQRLAQEGVRLVAMLLRKNADYGSSAWQRPLLAPDCDVSAAIRVRMSDKIARLQKLLGGSKAEVSESIEDTETDLAGYLILDLARPKDGE